MRMDLRASTWAVRGAQNRPGTGQNHYWVLPPPHAPRSTPCPRESGERVVQAVSCALFLCWASRCLGQTHSRELAARGLSFGVSSRRQSGLFHSRQFHKPRAVLNHFYPCHRRGIDIEEYWQFSVSLWCEEIWLTDELPRVARLWFRSIRLAQLGSTLEFLSHCPEHRWGCGSCHVCSGSAQARRLGEVPAASCWHYMIWKGLEIGTTSGQVLTCCEIKEELWLST